jgi:hypothetical protein
VDAIAYKREGDKKAERDRINGYPHRVPQDEAVKIRNRLRFYGMTDRRMSEQAEENGIFIHESTISMLGRRGTTCDARTLKSMRLLRPEKTPSKRIDSLGAVRILQGFVYAGYSQNWLSLNVVYGDNSDSKCSLMYANRILRGRTSFVLVETFERLVKSAEQLEFVSPESMGVAPWIAERSRRHAVAHEWAPLSCWDDDTLRDADAVAQWTGACGTIAGYNLHNRASSRHWDSQTSRWVVGCRPCRVARNEYKSARNR